MIETGLVEALNDSINRLNAGSSLADCLRRHPQYAAELRPLLEAGQTVRQNQPSVAEAEAAAARQQFRFEQALVEPPRPFPLMPFARLAASLVLVIAFMLGGVGLAAESSIPGDTLYPMKLLTESLRLQMIGNAVDLEAQFADRRIDEARQLLDLRRAAEMTLSGTIDTVQSDGVLVEGLLIQTNPTGIPVGSRVQARIVSSQQGELIARDIIILDEPADPPPQSTSPPPTLNPSDTPTPTETVMTREPTLTPTRQPTMRPSPTPTIARVDNGCDALPDGWVAYTVQVGDTLSELTVNSGGDLDTVIAANCLTDAGRIVVGTILYLPRQPVRPEATATQTVGDTRPTNRSANTSGAARSRRWTTRSATAYRAA